MAGHGSPPPEDRAHHPNRKVSRNAGGPSWPRDPTLPIPAIPGLHDNLPPIGPERDREIHNRLSAEKQAHPYSDWHLREGMEGDYGGGGRYHYPDPEDD